MDSLSVDARFREEKHPGRWRLGSRRLRLCLVAILLLIAAYALRRPLFFGNFAVVEPGRVFRSAQPDHTLESVIRSHRVRSIVNLRGGRPSDSFYADEVATAKKLGVEFHDLPLSATRRPTRRQLLDILDLFGEARYPLLIHCKWGSDRTGLVSVLYRLAALGEPPRRALGEFTLSYGHVPLFGPQHLHEPIEEYDAWLRDRKLTHSPGLFRGWVEREYRDLTQADAMQ